MWLLRLKTEDGEEYSFLYEKEPMPGKISDKIRLVMTDWGVPERDWKDLCRVYLVKLEVEDD